MMVITLRNSIEKIYTILLVNNVNNKWHVNESPATELVGGNIYTCDYESSVVRSVMTPKPRKLLQSSSKSPEVGLYCYSTFNDKQI